MQIIPTFSYPILIDSFDIKETLTENLEEQWDETARKDKDRVYSNDDALVVLNKQVNNCEGFYNWVTERGNFMFKEIMGLKGEVETKYTEVQVSQFGTIIPPHIHPNSYLTGYFFVQFDEQKGHTPLVLNNPFYNTFTPGYTFPQEKPTMWSSENFIPPVQEGQLILFPSNLQHFFPKQEADDRIVVAFDLMAK